MSQESGPGIIDSDVKMEWIEEGFVRRLKNIMDQKIFQS